MAIDIPDGVSAVHLAVVGRTARVLLRSDGRLHCAQCDQTGTWTSVGIALDAARLTLGACAHLGEVARKGLVRQAVHPKSGARGHEWVWHRTGEKFAAFPPDPDDPDNARPVLAGVLVDAMPRSWRDDGQGAAEYAESLADVVLANLRARGYVVLPEWAEGPRPATAVARSTRGFRAYRLEGEDAEVRP